MDFSRSKPLLVLPVLAFLNGCGGEGSDETTGGGNSSAAKNAYEGLTTEATLTVANHERFLRLAFGNNGIQTLPQALAFEADLDAVRTRIETGGSTDYQENILCTPGTQQVNATSNSTFSFFNISFEYDDCDGTNVDLDGTLRGTFSYDDGFLSGGNKTREELTYRNLDIADGVEELRLRGEEEATYNIAQSSSELEKEVTITDRDDRQTYYADIEVELEDDDQWHLDRIDSISGRIFDSEEGFVSLGMDGSTLVLEGASDTRVIVEYLPGDDDVRITFYDGPGDTPASTQTRDEDTFEIWLNQ